MKKVLFLSILTAALAAFFASSHPDGLEKVIGKGLAGHSLMTDYTIPFISHPTLSTTLAGICGVIIIFTLFWGFTKLIKKES
jgi:hypothetical protein